MVVIIVLYSVLVKLHLEYCVLYCGLQANWNKPMHRAWFRAIENAVGAGLFQPGKEMSVICGSGTAHVIPSARGPQIHCSYAPKHACTTVV